jgi:hypothetical protein
MSKQTKAIYLAIDALERERRRLYAAGEAAYQQGIRTVKIDNEGVTGEAFTFAEEGHAGYIEYTEAIQQMQDLIEILTDPGVTKAQPELFSLEDDIYDDVDRRR